MRDKRTEPSPTSRRARGETAGARGAQITADNRELATRAEQYRWGAGALNTFRHNSILDLFIRAWDTRGIQDMTIQANYFGALAQDDGTNPGFYSLKITGNDPGHDVSGLHLVDNTCEAQPFSLVDAGSAVVENWGNTGYQSYRCAHRDQRVQEDRVVVIVRVEGQGKPAG